MFLHFPNIFQTNCEIRGYSYFYIMAKLGITYENWIKGKLELNSAISYYKSSGYKPKFVAIGLFKASDQKRIFKNQKGYFDEQLARISSEWTRDFDQRYSRSREKEYFVSTTLDKIFLALRGNVKKLVEVGVVVLEDQELIDINLYLSALMHFNEIIVRGGRFTYETIPNPISRENSNNMILPEVYAECLWRMKEYIMDNYTQPTSQKLALQVETTPKVEAEKVESYFDIHIFRDAEAFQLFKDLIDFLQISEHRNSYLSIIYYELSSKSFDFAIKNKLLKQQFCDFCNQFEGIQIDDPTQTEAGHLRRCRAKCVIDKFNKFFKNRSKRKK